MTFLGKVKKIYLWFFFSLFLAIAGEEILTIIKRMTIYTLSSTDPDSYNEIIVSIPFYNIDRVVELTVLSLCSLFNVELLNEEDYIDIAVGGISHRIMADAICKFDLDGVSIYLDTLFERFGLTNMKAELMTNNTLNFVYSQPFKIVGMSYNFRMITGFYYITDNNNFPIEAVEVKENEFRIGVKAAPFCASTPVMYLVSNNGGNCYRMGLNSETVQTGMISMIINNSFSSGLPMIYQQADISSKVYNSDLTFMRLTLCDCNMRPLKLLNPMFITLSITEIPDQ
jgi:hypothetical protein